MEILTMSIEVNLWVFIGMIFICSSLLYMVNKYEDLYFEEQDKSNPKEHFQIHRRKDSDE